jgi:hypothetical protein
LLVIAPRVRIFNYTALSLQLRFRLQPVQEVIGEGHHVQIGKTGRQFGKTAVITNPAWSGRIKVKMDSDGSIKSYWPHELDSVDCSYLTFPTETMDAATVPSALLGAEQPIDIRALCLPPSPIGGNWEQGGSFPCTFDKNTWTLPPNSFCCVPDIDTTDERAMEKDLALQICVEHEGDWTEWINPKMMLNGEWKFFAACPTSKKVPVGSACESTAASNVCATHHLPNRVFRVAHRQQILDKPFPLKVFNLVILPPFSVLNVSPTPIQVGLMRGTSKFTHDLAADFVVGASIIITGKVGNAGMHGVVLDPRWGHERIKVKLRVVRLNPTM